jgi:hypothetical protein
VDLVALAGIAEVDLGDACSVLVETALALDPWAVHSAQCEAEVVQEDSMPDRTAVACMAAVGVPIEKQEVEQ